MEYRKRKAAGVSQKLPWTSSAAGKRRRTADGNLARSSLAFQCIHLTGGRATTELFGARVPAAAAGAGAAPALTQFEQLGHDLVRDAVAQARGERTLEIYDEVTNIYEEFCVRGLGADHPENRRLNAMRAAIQSNDTRFRAAPYDPATFLNFVAVMRASTSERLKLLDGSTFQGRGVGYKRVETIWCGLKYVDRALTGDTSLGNETLKSVMKRLKRGYVPKPAKAFDVAEVLPRFMAAIFEREFEGRTNPFNTSIQRVEVYSLFFFCLATCARRSLATLYCPAMSQVDFSDEMDADGVPFYYTIALKAWKGNEDRKKTQSLTIRRNRVSARLCPVVAMLTWIRTLRDIGIEDGPLFPCLEDGHNTWRRCSEGKLLKMSPGIFSSTWGSVAWYLGGDLERTTPHSLRRSVVKWAARCGGQQQDIAEAGRWESTGGAFPQYWRDGSAKRLRDQASGLRDPILNVWVWSPTVDEPKTR